MYLRIQNDIKTMIFLRNINGLVILIEARCVLCSVETKCVYVTQQIGKSLHILFHKILFKFIRVVRLLHA
jgi:hypothetical protein